jgi:hypothetical protein
MNMFDFQFGRQEIRYQGENFVKLENESGQEYFSLPVKISRLWLLHRPGRVASGTQKDKTFLFLACAHLQW